MVEGFDLSITGGRVIDPESGLDATKSVGVTAGRITYVGDVPIDGVREIDASGLVVCPGFIDLHSHAQNLPGLRLQALDGVTSSLELEGGALPAADHYAWAEEQGRPINFGFSAGWAYARMQVLDGVSCPRPQDDENARVPIYPFARFQDAPRWRGPATPTEIVDIVASVRSQIDDGAIGVGVLAGYAPDSTTEELHALAELGAELNQPLFVHSRSMADRDENGSVDAVRELIGASREFDAPIHLCHMNSTSGLRVAQIVEELDSAQKAGVRITTEAYPYSAGATVIGAAFLAPDKLSENNKTPQSVTYLKTGEQVADEERLAEIRAADPGGMCVLSNFDLNDPEQRDLLLKAVTFPGAAIASDAMQLTFVGEESERKAAEHALTGDVWPLPDGLYAHPRSAGCFAKALSQLARESNALSLAEVIRRAAFIPATILADAAPCMRSKGRIQVGADADITIFNETTVAPQADYERLRPSAGMEHVLVGGSPIVEDGTLRVDALPGRPIKSCNTR